MNKLLNSLLCTALFLSCYLSAMGPQRLGDFPEYYANIVDRLTRQPVLPDSGNTKRLFVSHDDALIAFYLETLIHPDNTHLFVTQAPSSLPSISTNNIDYKVDVQELTTDYTRMINFLQQGWLVKRENRYFYFLYKKIPYSDTFRVPHVRQTKALLSQIITKFNAKFLYCDDHSLGNHGLIIMHMNLFQFEHFNKVFNVNNQQ